MDFLHNTSGDTVCTSTSHWLRVRYCRYTVGIPELLVHSILPFWIEGGKTLLESVFQSSTETAREKNGIDLA